MAFTLFAVFALIHDPAEQFPKAARETAVAATVRVSNRTKDTAGSGVYVGRKGTSVYVLTAYHVVAGAEDLEVTTFSGGKDPKPDRKYRKVEVVAVVGGVRDLALLRLVTEDRLGKPAVHCPAKETPAGAGFRAVAVGCPQGGVPAGVVQVVAGKKLIRRGKDERAAYCWEVDAKHQSGDSGGGLFDGNGRLLGICSGNSGQKSYFAHTDEIRRFLQENNAAWLAE